MKSMRRAANAVPDLVGYLVLALVIAAGSCRVNRLKAQEDLSMKNFCSEEHLRSLYGDDWHIYYAINMCWLYEPTPAAFARPATSRPALSRVTVRGR